MTDERKPDPKDNRDFLAEAVKIAEGHLGIVPRREHIKALHQQWIGTAQAFSKLRTMLARVVVILKSGKLPKPEDVPYITAMIQADQPPPIATPPEEKN